MQISQSVSECVCVRACAHVHVYVAKRKCDGSLEKKKRLLTLSDNP
jgi:hypothetical protein